VTGSTPTQDRGRVYQLRVVVADILIRYMFYLDLYKGYRIKGVLRYRGGHVCIGNLGSGDRGCTGLEIGENFEGVVTFLIHTRAASIIVTSLAL
jgi:hypothetical protein